MKKKTPTTSDSTALTFGRHSQQYRKILFLCTPPSWLMLIPLNLSIHSFLIMADPALRVAALLESIPAALE